MSKEQFEEEFKFKPVVDSDIEDIPFTELPDIDSDVNELVEDIGELHIDGVPDHQKRYFGNSSGATLVRTVRHVKREVSNLPDNVLNKSKAKTQFEGLKASVFELTAPYPVSYAAS